MYQFFVEQNQLVGDRISILGSDVNHIKNVLRMKRGERVRVSVRNSMDEGEANTTSSRSFFGIIDTILEDEVLISVESEDENGTELSNRIYLFQGLPKGDKMELIIQKAVELGVNRIVPVVMKRSIVKIDDKKAQSKIARWQQIAEAAAKQSKRDIIPTIANPMNLKEALKETKDFDLSMMPYEQAKGMAYTRELLECVKPGQKVAIFIGPEGGFEASEVEMALEMGTKPVTLGRRILRTETAGLAMLSMLNYVLEA